MSASLIELGCEAIAVDHKRVQGASAPTMIADFTTSEGSSLVTSWLQLPECVGFFEAPPCGTCARAREITSVPGPPPLRTDEEPDGISSLQGVSFERVLSANKLYDALAKFCMLGAQRGLTMVIENPRRSLYWKTSFFSKIRHLFQ